MLLITNLLFQLKDLVQENWELRALCGELRQQNKQLRQEPRSDPSFVLPG